MVKMTVSEDPRVSMEILSEMVKVPDVSGSYDRGVEDGKKTEYDRFWDAAQQNGTRTEYVLAFGGYLWTAEIFKPKYDIRPIYADMMFGSNIMGGSLSTMLSSAGVVLDFGSCQSMAQCFAGSLFTELGVVDCRNTTALTQVFANMAKLRKIEKWIVKNTNTYANTFLNCAALEEITIEGMVGQTGLNLSKSTKLTHDSLMSIIDALQKDVTGKTLSLGSANLAKLTNAEKAVATQKGWTLA